MERGKILFIDDEEGAVRPYIAHLREEGFTNLIHVAHVNTFNEVVQQKADLVFLDITGVAATLAPAEEGVALLRHLRQQSPWTQVVVLSGSMFPADRAQALGEADLCITKASLSLAELLSITEEQLTLSLSAGHRNSRIARELSLQIEELHLGWYRAWRLRRLLASAFDGESDPSFDWSKWGARAKTLLEVAGPAVEFGKALLTQ